MNQRILELAQESGLYHQLAKGTPYPSAMTAEGCESAYEKFAELIVRECICICEEMAAKCAGLPGDGALAKDCAYWIKQDFGVE